MLNEQKFFSNYPDYIDRDTEKKKKIPSRNQANRITFDSQSSSTQINRNEASLELSTTSTIHTDFRYLYNEDIR